MRSERGFTLVDTLVAVALFVVISGMSVVTMSAALPMMRVDGQVNRVMGMLQYGREMAISKQRDVDLRFDLPNNTVSLVRRETGGDVAVQTIIFENNVRFMQFTGMSDTPEGFGNSSAVYFNGAASLTFISDGSFVDAAGVPVNGTMFLGISGKNETARAITVTGSTARARFYKWSSPNLWVAR
jgi:Tfp pilus assembly protein FimT